MVKKLIISFFILTMLCASAVYAQFTSEEVTEFEKWEKFLEEAEVTESKQMQGRTAVTSPWVITLEKDGITQKALWKNPSGRMGGFIEGWEWEIAAYRLSKYLHLNMVPPTVERRFKGDRGSCQYWVEGYRSLMEILEKQEKKPSYKIIWWNRSLYLQRAFDSLIANEDRHQNQYLVSDDWRMILIDHSRAFRQGGRYNKRLMYGKDGIKGNEEFKQLPMIFVEKLKGLDEETLKAVVGEYLKPKEIEAVLIRKDLILKEIDDQIKAIGEDKFYYVLQ
ncbi:MAG: hypothetical protein KJ874_06795 [Acidobacteria bacterium]|nr:hypothetical protein [Acidobacteriota bacterium]